VSAIDDLISHNDDYARAFRDRGLSKRPIRRLAVVACMDSRLDLFQALGLDHGEAHVIRNAGGVVTDDVIRSLLISQRLLGTRAVLLVHHTDCGLLTFRDDDLKDEIQRETGIRPAFALESFSDLDDNIRQSIARLHASPFLAAKDDIRGFVYDVRTGRLREVLPDRTRAGGEAFRLADT
jgi:carbonic anhydrase